MLQDLDILAARIGQIVQLTRQLQADRGTLQSRLAGVERERDELREQLARQKEEHKSMSERLVEHDNEVDAARVQAEASLAALRAQAESAEAALRDEIARHRADGEKAIHNLQASQSECARLRAAAGAARDRLDAILERLPGAPQE